MQYKFEVIFANGAKRGTNTVLINPVRLSRSLSKFAGVYFIYAYNLKDGFRVEIRPQDAEFFAGEDLRVIKQEIISLAAETDKFIAMDKRFCPIPGAIARRIEPVSKLLEPALA